MSFAFIQCPRLQGDILVYACSLIQNKDCPNDCNGNKYLKPFWERQNLTSHSSRAGGHCAFRTVCDDAKADCAKSCLRYRRRLLKTKR